MEYACWIRREHYSVFFFSSRRRHTRFDCDWSSDVCSSDLSELEQLRARAAKALGVSEEAAELRALRELLERSAPQAAPPEARSRPPPARGGLPQRLYLLLGGRGLEGRGMPMEGIDMPCIVGSERRRPVWGNS